MHPFQRRRGYGDSVRGRNESSKSRSQQHGYSKSRSYNESDEPEASGYNRDPPLSAGPGRAWDCSPEDKVDGTSSPAGNNNNNHVSNMLGPQADLILDDEAPEAVRMRDKRNSIDIGCDILRSKMESLVVSNHLQNEVRLEECPSGVDKSTLLGRKPKENSQSNNNKDVPSGSDGVLVGDLLVFDDLEEEESSWSPPASRLLQGSKNRAIVGKPITLNLATQLRYLMFGSVALTFNSGWLGQGFTFSNHPKVLYGIVQKKGGPCGVLAAVQAYVLKAMMYGSETRPEFRARDPLSPSAADTRMALALALCDILWMCGERKKATVAMCSQSPHFNGLGRYNPDGVTETTMMQEFEDRESLLSHLQANVGHFMQDGGHGCILAIYSAIISRGIEQVKDDMDVSSGTLMGAHGYCTQEMVNLLLTGKATSNVFDNIIELDTGGQEKAVLKGIQHTCDIGFLSLFEHYNSCEVGSNLKCPRFPIWVVCSESHFSVLFSTRKELVEDCRNQRRFDLYYYDGLAKQEDQIRLTVDTTRRISRGDAELIPPLESCIQTKWKSAAVDWNGFEPIL